MNIKDFRKKKKITQAELGQLIGVSQQQIAKYELGICKPGPKVAKKLVDALDIGPAEAWAMIYGEDDET